MILINLLQRLVLAVGLRGMNWRMKYESVLESSTTTRAVGRAGMGMRLRACTCACDYSLRLNLP